MTSSATAQSYPVLSKKELAWTLAGLVLIFLFVNGPVWLGPWDATGSILYSYLPIPFVVAVLLLRHHRLTLLPWLLHSLELIVAKFMVTAIFLVGLWMIRGGPPPLERLMPLSFSKPKPLAKAVIVPTVLPPESLITLEGRVVDAWGAPVAQTWVAVSAGLDGLQFAPKPQAFESSLGPEGYAPHVTVLQVGQAWVLKSRDRALHTAQVLSKGGTALFNIPVLAKPEGVQHVFQQPVDDLTVRCTVHGRNEKDAQLFVLPHPFFTQTDSEGRFSLPQVPKAAMQLRLLGRDAVLDGPFAPGQAVTWRISGSNVPTRELSDAPH